MWNLNQDPNPAPNPDFILDQLRDAFASSYDQKPFDDKQVSGFTQVGSDAQALHLWKSQIPEQQLSLVYTVLDTKEYQNWLDLTHSGKLLVHWTYWDSGP
jgi:hypothetical protein